MVLYTIFDRWDPVSGCKAKIQKGIVLRTEMWDQIE